MNFSNGFMYGMHACGFMNEIMFTNSLDALMYWYGRGIKLFEVDVDLADDNVWVLCHDFGKATFEKMELDDIPEAQTSQWFALQKIYSKSSHGLTTMTLESLIAIMAKHDDILIMVDPKKYTESACISLLRALNKYTEDRRVAAERIVFEVYNMDMIASIDKFPHRYQYQYCYGDEVEMGNSTQMRAWDLEKTLDYLLEHDIHIISYPWKFLVNDLDSVKRIKNRGFAVFSKTRNNIFHELVQKTGVNVNLVDVVLTDDEFIRLRNYRKKYFEQYEQNIMEIFGG